MKKECIFCKIGRGEIESDFIYENDNFFSIRDIHPMTEGHSLVISKRHFENTLELPDSLGSELLDCIKKTAIKLIEETKSGGFNLHANTSKVAGQLVNHVHFHIIPRKDKDGFHPCA